MNKKIIVISSLALVVTICAAAWSKNSYREYTNLKVLPKNISHPDLDKTMEMWATSLGVHCNFCHARNEQTNKMDFPSDAKPEKTIARHMFQMTSKINKKFFKAEKDSLGMVMESSVNCYTCHRGHEHPEIKVPERQHGPGGPPAGGNPPPPPAPPSGK